ncbi:MAG: hypothetical protein QXG35_02765 [Nitrososphaerota archaeon]
MYKVVSVFRMVRRPSKHCEHPGCFKPVDVILKDLSAGGRPWLFCSEHVKAFLDMVSKSDIDARFEAYVHVSAAGLEVFLKGE